MEVYTVKLHLIYNVHPTMCSSESNLKNELLPVCAGVIHGLSVLRDMHVELGHTLLQVIIQLCNLNSE